MTPRRTLAALAVCALIAAGCGSSKDISPTVNSTTATAPGGALGSTASSLKKFVDKSDVGAAAWPAPPDAMARTAAAGLKAETAESLNHHVHAHLDVYINGAHRAVPAGIGIDITNSAVHSGTVDGQPAYGGISSPCKQPCISPLHTHDISGTLHTESPTDVDNTLGEFFTEWDVRLDGSCVGEFCAPQTPIVVYANGVDRTTEAGAIKLTDKLEVAVIIGTPPANIPTSSGF